ncbi:MAG: hypothetical protein ACLQVD_09830 [Capsulimonadaceae bacterium]
MADAKPIAFPNSFRASPGYIIGFGVFTAIGAGVSGMAFRHHMTDGLMACGTLTAIGLAFFLIVATTLIRVDDVGIEEACLFFRSRAPWSQVGVMERMVKAYSLRTSTGRDLLLFCLISYDQQKAVADEAVRRAGLSLSRDKAVYPVVEKWTRA